MSYPPNLACQQKDPLLIMMHVASFFSILQKTVSQASPVAGDSFLRKNLTAFNNLHRQVQQGLPQYEVDTFTGHNRFLTIARRLDICLLKTWSRTED